MLEIIISAVLMLGAMITLYKEAILNISIRLIEFFRLNIMRKLIPEQSFDILVMGHGGQWIPEENQDVNSLL